MENKDTRQPSKDEKPTKGQSNVELYLQLLKDKQLRSKKVQPPKDWSKVILKP